VGGAVPALELELLAEMHEEIQPELAWGAKGAEVLLWATLAQFEKNRLQRDKNHMVAMMPALGEDPVLW
jgi:hypothetical protein